ncbi:MAG: hypothetical protein VXV96_18125 [Bdellovibrionota bacterium]|nr:hypothetical protein [Bdellovibrionota bacterium]
MKSVISILCLLFLSSGFATEAPVIGKFDIESAQCDGERFLWKKHDQIIISQKVLALEGEMTERSSEEEKCRFQDVFRLNEDGVFEGSSRNIICYDVIDGEKASKARVEVVEVMNQVLKVDKERISTGAKVSLIGMELCQGELSLELSYSIQ